VTDANGCARSEILSRLRATCQRQPALFHRGPVATPRTGPPAAVTHADGDGKALARLFGRKLEAISGSYEIVESPAEVGERVKRRVLDWDVAAEDRKAEAGSRTVRILSWVPEALPIPNLEVALREAGIELIAPADLRDRDTRRSAASIEIGLTGVEAAFAATGSLAFACAPGKSRASSLLPLRHIAIVPYSRIQPTPEAWLSELRASGRLDAVLRQSRQLVFVTGPSKSADIELNLTLGVHGPRNVHAVLFDDSR
jgi:L-lactate utilization protein LutC